MTSILFNDFQSSMMNSFHYAAPTTAATSSEKYQDEDSMDNLLSSFDDNDLFQESFSMMETIMSPNSVMTPSVTLFPSTLQSMRPFFAPMEDVPSSSSPPSMMFTTPACISPSPSMYSQGPPSIIVTPTELTRDTPKKRRLPAETEMPTKKRWDTKIRRDRNREHARSSRLRKKSLTAQLEQSLVQLKNENETLRKKVYAMVGKKEADAMVKKCMKSQTHLFVNVLKTPKNRIMDNTSIAFLQSLRKDIPFTCMDHGER